MPTEPASIIQKLDILVKDLQTCIEHSKTLIAESTALIDAVKGKLNGNGPGREAHKIKR